MRASAASTSLAGSVPGGTGCVNCVTPNGRCSPWRQLVPSTRWTSAASPGPARICPGRSRNVFAGSSLTATVAGSHCRGRSPEAQADEPVSARTAAIATNSHPTRARILFTPCIQTGAPWRSVGRSLVQVVAPPAARPAARSTLWLVAGVDGAADRRVDGDRVDGRRDVAGGRGRDGGGPRVDGLGVGQVVEDVAADADDGGDGRRSGGRGRGRGRRGRRRRPGGCSRALRWRAFHAASGQQPRPGRRRPGRRRRRRGQRRRGGEPAWWWCSCHSCRLMASITRLRKMLV